MKEIPLTRGLVALVDDEDFETLNQHRWCATLKRYTWVACRGVWKDGKTAIEYMHRTILKAPAGTLVDHKNGSGLDNQKQNLRLCTIAQNNCNRNRMQSTNTTGYRGVTRRSDRRSGKIWRAEIWHNNKKIHIGVYDSIDAAVAARKAAELQFYGEFAPGRY